MISAAVLDAMVASGCTPEQIAAAVKADIAAHEAGVEAKREYERDRKRAQRANKVALSHDVPGTTGDNSGHAETDGDNTETVSLSPVPLLPPTPPNNPLTPKPIQKNNSARGFRLPEDWVLTGPDLAFALSKSFTEQQTGEIFEKFTNYWWSATGAKATKKNWHQAWKVWILNTKPPPRAGPQTAKPLTISQQRRQETRNILDDLDNFARSGSGSSEADIGLLPGYSRQ